MPLIVVIVLTAIAHPAAAAELDARDMSALWGLPFAGLLLSIALMPLLAGRIWHHHYGAITAGWSALFLVPFALAYGAGAAGMELAHVMVQEYVPFLTLLLALYTVGGGILLRGTLIGTPLVNTAILASNPNRPAEYGATDGNKPAYETMEDLVRTTGLKMALTEPEEVASFALEGICQGRFWLLPESEDGDAKLRDRISELLARANPVSAW